MPHALREGFRFKQFGAPYRGGYRDWPIRWFLPVETALNVYEVLTTVNRAMSNMEGDALAKWNSDNRRIVDAALAIQKVRDDE